MAGDLPNASAGKIHLQLALPSEQFTLELNEESMLSTNDWTGEFYPFQKWI